MKIESTEFLGSTVLALSTLLGTYSLFSRTYKSSKSEKPPAAPPSEFDTFRTHVQSLLKDLTTDLRHLRQELKTDYHGLLEHFLQASTEIHSLLQRNAQHIAALLAQQEMAHQRLSELSLKLDKLYEKLIPPKP